MFRQSSTQKGARTSLQLSGPFGRTEFLNTSKHAADISGCVRMFKPGFMPIEPQSYLQLMRQCIGNQPRSADQVEEGLTTFRAGQTLLEAMPASTAKAYGIVPPSGIADGPGVWPTIRVGWVYSNQGPHSRVARSS